MLKSEDEQDGGKTRAVCLFEGGFGDGDYRLCDTFPDLLRQ